MIKKAGPLSRGFKGCYIKGNLRYGTVRTNEAFRLLVISKRNQVTSPSRQTLHSKRGRVRWLYHFFETEQMTEFRDKSVLFVLK